MILLGPLVPNDSWVRSESSCFKSYCISGPIGMLLNFRDSYASICADSFNGSRPEDSQHPNSKTLWNTQINRDLMGRLAYRRWL